jgi:CheY-like chemotaxis protein
MNIRKILLVDDDANIRKLAKMSLERVGGWDVQVVAGGQEALDSLCGLLPDLIILDVMMPGLDGLAVLERLKGNPSTAAVPVILMTAKVQSQQISDSKALGAVGLIEKPFDPLNLHEEILAFFK